MSQVAAGVFEVATSLAAGGQERAESPWRLAVRRFIRQPAGVIGSAVLALYLAMALIPGVMAPLSPLTASPAGGNKAPSALHLLGTDPIGRDVLSRIIYGARPALEVGFLAVGIGAVIGALSGLAAGFYKNRPLNAVMRLWDGVFAVPAVLIGLILAATFGSGVTTVAVALGIASAPALARVSRAAALVEAEQGYVEACRALGFRRFRVFVVHVLPNTLGSVVVQLALTASFAILLESGLAYLGVSAQPPNPDWGAMVADSLNYLSTDWWYGLFPGLAITILVVALNLLANAARDALDPRSER